MNPDYIRRMSINGGYVHKEALCLMEYRSDDRREVEYIWNSRDGVTPFTVTSRRGTEMTHVNWMYDRRIPDFVPQPGSRIFVDLTPEKAQEYAARRVARSWDDPTSPAKDLFVSREEAIERLTANSLSQPGAPDLIVVE
jgi:hypothetical protein